MTIEQGEKGAKKGGRKWPKRVGMVVGSVVALLGMAAGVLELRSPSQRPVDATKRYGASSPERVARGKYIANAEAHCMDCHSERDWKTHGGPALPGLEGAGWNVPAAENHMPGRVFAPNITPDVETGIGALSDDAIARALREGVSHDGRALFMMPWKNFRGLSDDDVGAVIAYLRSLAPVSKRREVTKIDPPVSWMVKAMPEPLTAPVPATTTTDPVARGRHLAQVGQCQDCHTPVDARHQPLPGMAFAGGQEFVLGGVTYRSANITPHASGISHYDEALFIKTIRTGNVGGRRLAPIMPWLAMRDLSDDDLKALWAYLKTVAPVAHDVERAPLEVAANPTVAEH
jgi:mono/diheme cytochrome c family protein